MDTAVVTGAGRGLGRHIARGLADKGLAVLVTDVDAAAARDTAAAIGGSAWAAEQDVRDPESHRRVAAAAAERGELAVWVNNAGVLRSAPAWELGERDVRDQVEVNLLGLIWGARAAVHVMRRQGRGHIINIASISSLVPAPGLAVYGATKQAVLGFSISLAGDLRHAGIPIEVSALCPDAIDTDMTRSVKDDKEAALLFSASKLLRADDVAAMVLDLVDHPRLMTTRPRVRGALAHMFRPFPGVVLKMLEQFRKLGERHQRRDTSG